MRAFTIARNTFREAFHLPVLYVIILGSLVLLLIVGQLPGFTLSIYDDINTLKDFAVATATLCGVLVAIFAAINVITAEIENWTVVTILSKPVKRWEFVVGKFIGLVYTLGALFGILTVLYILLVWWGMWSNITDYQGVYPELKREFWQIAWQAADQLWRAMVLCFLQVMVLSAIAVACCVRGPMIVSVVVFFLAFVVGHFAEPLARAADGMSSVAGLVVRCVVPNLESLNFAQEVGMGALISPAVMGWAFLYASAYAAAAVLVGLLLFRNREVI